MHNEAMVEEHHHDTDGTDVFGFWLYIMTDCILFACLFATYIVLNFANAPGPMLKSYLNLSDILVETFFLLASNFTFGLAIVSMYQDQFRRMQAWLAASFLLGASFIYMELSEFIHLASEGFRWDVNGRASSFFTLVGTHGLHVSCGLFWIMLMIIQISVLREKHIIQRRMTYLGLFWNFLDIVWIFVFTIVYLMGAL